MLPLASVFQLLVCLAFTSSAFAQSSNATCTADTQWMFNSKGQSPCVMASYLRAACSGNYNLRALPDGYIYTGPSDPDYADACWCSSVTFSLYQACSICQSQHSLEKWGQWTTNCTGSNAPSNGSFPMDIPAGTAIPAWAYALYPPAASFSVEVVQAFIPTNNTEFTSSSRNSATASIASAGEQPSSSSESSSSGGSSNAGAIAGGVVGGVVGLALIAALIYWLIQRRNRQRATPDQVYFKAQGSDPIMLQHAPTPAAAPPIIAAPTPRYPKSSGVPQYQQPVTPMLPSPALTPKPNNAKQVYMPRPGSTGMQYSGHPYAPEPY